MKMPKWVALIVAVCLVVPLSVLAGPPMAAEAATYPCLFYGTATVDIEPVEAGTEITAWVGGEQVASALTGAGGLDNNEYTLPVELESPAEVSFKIGALDAAETATWVQFGSVEVNLTATTEEEPEVPTYPCEFYGTSLVDNESVAAGIEITAWVGAERVGSGLTGAGGLPDNKFSLIVELEEEIEVSFKIGTLDANETATWVQYGSVEVTLTASTGVTYPCLFYGTASVDDEPVEAGTEITAWVGTEQVGSAIAGEGQLASNQFCLVVELENPVEVSFKIGTLWASETATWVQYGSVEVNLTATSAAPYVPPYTPPPAPTIDTDLFGTEASFETNNQGKILETIEATSEDGMLTITIPKDTICLDIEGQPLDTLEVAVDESPPDPPEDAHIIGLAYDFGPAGATFDPPITLTYTYDPEALPDVADLFLAYYDEESGGWVELDCVVDAVNHTITASVAHFTTFAIIGWVPPVPPPPPPAPACFTISSLVVSPSELPAGEEVTITVLVANTGGESGSYQVTLVINDLVEATKEVTVRAGLSKEVTFSVTREEADTYAVTVDGLSDSFTVVVVPPEPAAFSVSYLSVSRLEVEPGETVAITVLVANTGGESGSYTVVLKIDGVKEAEETVTIAAGESQEVSFSVTGEEAGSYTVAVDGLSGSFTVVAPPDEEEEEEEEEVPTEPGINWPLIGGIIGGVIVVGLGVFLWWRRRRAY